MIKINKEKKNTLTTWEKLTEESIQEKKDKFINTQTKIRTGQFKCDYTQINTSILSPILKRILVGGEAYIFEQENPELTLIFATKYIPSKDKWIIVATMSYPFTYENSTTIFQLFADKIMNFMQEKKITEILGSELITYKYEDSIYAEAGYSQQDFLQLIAEEFDKKNLIHKHNNEERRFEIQIKDVKEKILDMKIKK